MDTVLHWMYWIGLGFGGLFFVAVVVAWWEHLGRQSAPEQAFMPTPPRVTSVDLNLDALPEATNPPGDQSERRRALDGALERMTQPGSLGEPRRGWVDTKPMIGLGTRAEAPAPQNTSRA